MKSVSRREMLKTMALGATGTILAACAPQAVATQAPAAAKPTDTVQAAAPSTGPVKLTMWTYTGDEGFLGEMTKLYTSNNPNVTVDVTIVNDYDQ